MSYRIHKSRKVVEVVGEADLDVIIAKVRKIGGKDWVIKTAIPEELVERIADRLASIKNSHPAPIGFRLPEQESDYGLVTGLPFSPPNVEP